MSDSPRGQADRAGSDRARPHRVLVALLWGVGVFVAWNIVDFWFGAARDALLHLPFGLLAGLGSATVLALIAAGLVFLLRRFASAPRSIWLAFLAWGVLVCAEGLLYVFWVVPTSAQIAVVLGARHAAVLGFEPTTQNLALSLGIGIFRAAAVVVAARIAVGLDVGSKLADAKRTSAST